MQFKVRIEGNGISSDVIEQLEKEYKIRFPAALKYFYIEHNGAEIEESKIICDGDEYNVVSVIYPEAGNPTLEMLIEENRIYNNWKEGHIPFAADWGDDLYCWDNETGAIWLYFPDDDDPILVADSIDSFFSRLVFQREGNNMAEQKILSLGSIVKLDGGIQKLLIIARALNVKNGDKEFFFDYGAVAYPEGLIGDQMAYFNHENIATVVFEGYRDEDDAVFVKRIEKYLAENPNLQKGSADTWGKE